MKNKTDNHPLSEPAIVLQMGILASKKGKGGGYYLIKRPEEVNLADVIKHIDGAIALIPCVSYKYYQPLQHCKVEVTCGIRSIIKDIRDETVNMQKKISLADILLRGEQLMRKHDISKI